MHRLIRHKGDSRAEAFLSSVETRVPHYGCDINEQVIRELIAVAAEQEARNVVLKRDTYALKQYFRSFKLCVRELPYGLHIDGSETPQSEIDRFLKQPQQLK